MASPFDFLPDDSQGGNEPDILSRIAAPADRHADEYVAVAQEIAKRQQEGLKRSSQKLKDDQWLLAQQGQDPIEEPRHGFLMNLLDTLGTPGQWVRGGIANLADAPGYGELPFLDAVKKGADEDLYTGQLLRNFDVFNPEKSPLGKFGANFARGAAGTVGDVLTDPLNMITTGLFGGTARRIGGIPANEAFQFPSGEGVGEAWSRMSGENLERLLGEARTRYALPEGQDLSAQIVGDLSAQADREASQVFQGLRGLNTRDDVLSPEVLSKKDEYLKMIGLSPEEAQTIDIDALYQKPAIRGTGPLAGAPLFGRIPFFGDKEFDIPGLTPLSEKLYDAVKNVAYGTTVRFPKFASEKAAEGSSFYKVVDAIGQQLEGAGEKTSRLMTTLLSPFSLRVKASGEVFGSSAAKDAITEEARNRGMLYDVAANEVKFAMRKLVPHFERAPQEMSAALEEGMRTLGSGKFDDSLGRLQQEFNQRAPGLGNDTADFFSFLNSDIDRIAKDAGDNGTLRGVIQNLVHKMYNPVEGMVTPQQTFAKYGQLAKGFYDEFTPNLSLERIIQNLDQTKVEGFTANKNPLELYGELLYAHKRALAEKDFAERLVFNYGLPADVRDRVASLANAKSDAERVTALRASAETGVSPSAFPVRRFSDGTAVTPEAYDRIDGILRDPSDPAFKAALAQAQDAGFQFHPGERDEVASSYEHYANTQAMRLGKEGETAFTPAGGTVLADEYRKPWDKTLSGVDAAFWRNNIPQGLADAVQESHQQYSLLTEHLKKLEKAGKDPATDALAYVLKAYQSFHKTMKAGATVFWPGYWAGNLQGSQIQGLEQANFLGQQFNISNLLRTHKVLQGADFVANNGRVIPHETMMSLMRQGGVTPRATSAPDMIGSVADQLHFGQNTESLLAGEGKEQAIPTIPGLTGFKGMTDRLYKTLPNFGARLEAFGREHLFMNLIEQGHDPMSAGEAVNRLLIDYAHGKTKFERQVMNNAFFFYSFSRGQATNNFMAMMRKPGVLSTQLSLHKEIAEMLTDPNHYDNSPDIDEAIRTSRYQDALATYVGTNPKTGLPQVLSGTRLPIEDISKFGTISLPKSFNGNDILNAVGDTASRTAQMAFSQTNPALRGVFEALIAKRNLFFDRPIDDPALNRVAKWEASTNTIVHWPAEAIPERVWSGLDEGMKKFLGGKDNGDGTMSINPYAMTALTYFTPFASRFLSTRKALTQPGVDPDVKYMRLLSGTRVEDVDPEKTTTYDALDRATRALRSHGLAETKGELKRRRAFGLDDEEVPEEE
jgi:hypothetical protein